MEGIAGSQAKALKCTCHRKKETEHFTDQHAKGCNHGKGYINRAHKDMQTEVVNLATHAGFFKGSRNITAPTSKTGKEMDLVLIDPNSSVNYHIDFRRTDSLGESAQDSSTRKLTARQKAFRKVTYDKADCKAEK